MMLILYRTFDDSEPDCTRTSAEWSLDGGRTWHAGPQCVLRSSEIPDMIRDRTYHVAPGAEMVDATDCHWAEPGSPNRVALERAGWTGRFATEGGR
ncbi:MAG: hypothetical protein GY716_15895 [bacterium]|nr:hypothetical protein [bacterium]